MCKIPIVDADGNPAWSELFPIEKVEELRDIVGARHFSSQMMLEYISEDKARLEPGALKFYDSEYDARTGKLAISNEELVITGYACYWDPSGGRSKSDASVCVLLYRDDKNRRAFIHDVRYLTVDDNDMHPLASQCEAVLNFMQTHGVNKIAIEVNGIGNALPEILREVALKRAQPAIVQKVINHQRKELRILDAIEPMLTTGRLYAHERIKTTPLLAEMLGWSPMAVSQPDDGLDAVAGALRCTASPTRTMNNAFRVLKAKTDFKL